jgi:hypothetical protein
LTNKVLQVLIIDNFLKILKRAFKAKFILILHQTSTKLSDRMEEEDEGNFKELCWHNPKSNFIVENQNCKNFEDNNAKLPEGAPGVSLRLLSCTSVSGDFAKKAMFQREIPGLRLSTEAISMGKFAFDCS